jgi:hypothetical protein
MGQVFISYSHDNADHQARVHVLAERLRADHIQVIIDQDKLPGGPAEGWPAWSEAQVRKADRVLVVASAAYRRRYEQEEVPGTGLGTVCEANAIRQALYETGGINERFRVILLSQEDEQEIPQQLAAYHRFSFFQETGYTELCAWLQGRRPEFSAKVAQITRISWPEPHPDHDWLLADRKEICASFQSMVTGRSAKRILLLEGPTNTGKTVLIARLRIYAEILGLKTAALDFKGCPGLEELFNALCLDLGPDILADSHKAQGSGRFFSLISDLQHLNAPLLLLFDTYEQASPETTQWLENQLLPRLDKTPALLIVIGGQRIPDHTRHSWGPQAACQHLAPITEVDHWIDFCRRKWSCAYLTDAHIEALTLSTHGDPGQIYALLESLVKAKLAAKGA